MGLLTVIILSVLVALVALYIIWIRDSDGDCKAPNFRCSLNGKCIKEEQVCNGFDDCPDAQEEAPIDCRPTSFPETRSSILQCQGSPYNSRSTIKSEAEIEMPRGCEYSKVLLHSNIGIICSHPSKNSSWSQIPWNELDMNWRTIAIKNGFINTTSLGGQVGFKTNLTSAVIHIEGQKIPVKKFPFLKHLEIENNYIESLEDGSLCHMENLCWLSLNGNGIRNLSKDAFCPLNELISLKMSENKLHLTDFQFKEMSKLKALYLERNEIAKITNETFNKLTNLNILYISRNRINCIDENALLYNTRLLILDLSHNRLDHLHPSIFRSQHSLKKIDLSYNPIQYLESELFAYLPNLQSLNIETLEIYQIDIESFRLMEKLIQVHQKKFGYCNFAPNIKFCSVRSEGLSSITDLLPGHSRTMVWIVGLLTIVGNLAVLVNNCRASFFRKPNVNRTKIKQILNIFITNLAMADLLMGVYLIILAHMDQEFRGVYSKVAYSWSKSWLCSLSGIMAMVSSEVSVIILTIMSVEMYLRNKRLFPQGRNLNPKLAKLTMAFTWIALLVLALAPGVLWQGGNTAFYGGSDLCFPIHLDERYPDGWQYTAVIFIGLNSSCLVLISFSYAMFLRTVTNVRLGTTPGFNNREKNLDLTFRIPLIVATDVLCWAPIIILKVAVLCGYELSKATIGWVVICVLPLNSAMNPILYTFSTKGVRNEISRHLRSCSGTRSNASQRQVDTNTNKMELQSFNIKSLFGRLSREKSSPRESESPQDHSATDIGGDFKLEHSFQQPEQIVDAITPSK